MDSVGARIKEERLRIGLTQEQVVADAGVTVQSQRRYEANQRTPDTNYLQALAGLGMDVYYILLGRREDEPSWMMLKPDERSLVKGYQSLNDESKSHFLGLLDALALQATNKGENTSVRKRPKD